MVDAQSSSDQSAQLAEDNRRFHDYCLRNGLKPGHMTIPDSSFKQLLNTLYPSKKEQ